MNKLRHYRDLRGYTLEELAKRAGTTKSYIWELENKDSNPSLSKAYAIAKILGFKITDVFPDPNNYIVEKLLTIKNRRD